MGLLQRITDIVDMKDMEDEAWNFANNTVRQALTGVFGLAENVLEYRRSATFAHRKALFHSRMVYSLERAKFRIFDRSGKLRRQRRRAMRWEAEAWADDMTPTGIPNLAQACCIPEPGKKAV